jgi:hypothetical protein
MELTTEQRAELEGWRRRGSTPHKQVQRAEMILLTADGVPCSQIIRVSSPLRGPNGQLYRPPAFNAQRNARQAHHPLSHPVSLPRLHCICTVLARRKAKRLALCTETFSFAN